MNKLFAQLTIEGFHSGVTLFIRQRNSDGQFFVFDTLPTIDDLPRLKDFTLFDSDNLMDCMVFCRRYDLDAHRESCEAMGERRGA